MTDRQSNGPLGPDPDTSAGDDGMEENGAEGGDEEATATDTAALEDLEAALESSRIERERAQERFVRLAAEFDNYRKRTEREKLDAWGRAQADLIAKMLDAIDDLERIADFDETTPSKALLEGIQLVEKKLLAAFHAAGLRRLEAGGKPFDPASMEALATVPTESPEEDETVADVFQAGYRFGDLLVRPARVRVRKLED